MAYSYKNDKKGMYIFLGVTALICFLLASSVIPFFAADNPRLPTADILLCFVCTLCAFTDVKKAALFAVSTGFLADLFILSPTALSPVVFLACVLVSRFVQGYFSRVGTLAVAISTLPCSLIRILVSVSVTAINAGIPASKMLWTSRFPMGIIVDFAQAIVLTFLMRVICKKLHLKADN